MIKIWASGTELECGPSLRLMVALTCNGKTEMISRTYNIDDLAEVHFKYESVIITDNTVIIKFSYSSRKLGSDKNSLIQMKLRCKSLNYSTKNVCANEWSNWQIIGEITTDNFDGEIYRANYDLNITVFEEKANTMLLKLYHDTEFTDFCLSTMVGEQVNIHKACLATHSDVFKTMLTGEWKETAEGKIKIEGVTKSTLQQLKDYMYLGTVPDEDGGLRPLLLIARCYMIKDLEDQCIRKLAETVSSKDLFSLMEFACHNNIPELVFAVTMLTQNTTIHEAHQLRKKQLVALKNDKNNDF